MLYVLWSALLTAKQSVSCCINRLKHKRCDNNDARWHYFVPGQTLIKCSWLMFLSAQLMDGGEDEMSCMFPRRLPKPAIQASCGEDEMNDGTSSNSLDPPRFIPAAILLWKKGYWHRGNILI